MGEPREPAKLPLHLFFSSAPTNANSLLPEAFFLKHLFKVGEQERYLFPYRNLSIYEIFFNKTKCDQHILTWGDVLVKKKILTWFFVPSYPEARMLNHNEAFLSTVLEMEKKMWCESLPLIPHMDPIPRASPPETPNTQPPYPPLVNLPTLGTHEPNLLTKLAGDGQFPYVQ